MSTPLFAVGSEVCLVESAKIGSLESYMVASVSQGLDGIWLYKIGVPARPPVQTATFGDRITLQQSYDFTLAEDELTTYCVAIGIVKASLTSQLNHITALEAAHCQEGTGST